RANCWLGVIDGGVITAARSASLGTEIAGDDGAAGWRIIAWSPMIVRVLGGGGPGRGPLGMIGGAGTWGAATAGGGVGSRGATGGAGVRSNRDDGVGGCGVRSNRAAGSGAGSAGSGAMSRFAGD